MWNIGKGCFDRERQKSDCSRFEKEYRIFRDSKDRLCF